MKAKLHPMFEQVSGQMGDLVYRVVRGRTIISRKPLVSAEGPTPEQAEQRERFKQAVAYGKIAMSDETVRALYEAAARLKNSPVFALTVADFLHAPTVESVDLSAYTGQTGDPIHIYASDDFGVIGVHVSISDSLGDPIESGNAEPTTDGTGRWRYTAQNAIPAGISLNVSVTATDRPGGTAVKTATKNL